MWGFDFERFQDKKKTLTFIQISWKNETKHSTPPSSESVISLWSHEKIPPSVIFGWGWRGGIFSWIQAENRKYVRSPNFIWGLERAAGAKKSLFRSVSPLETPKKCDFFRRLRRAKKILELHHMCSTPSTTHVGDVGWLVTQESGSEVEGGVSFQRGGIFSWDQTDYSDTEDSWT